MRQVRVQDVVALLMAVICFAGASTLAVSVYQHVPPIDKFRQYLDKWKQRRSAAQEKFQRLQEEATILYQTLAGLTPLIDAKQAAVAVAVLALADATADAIHPGPAPTETWLEYVLRAPGAVTLPVSGPFFGPFAIRYAIWYAKKRAYDKAIQLKQEKERDLQFLKSEYYNLLGKRAASEKRREDIQSQSREQSNIIDQANDSISELQSRAPDGMRILWNDVVRPVLHGLAVLTLLGLSINFLFRFILLRGWLRTTTV